MVHTTKRWKTLIEESGCNKKAAMIASQTALPMYDGDVQNIKRMFDSGSAPHMYNGRNGFIAFTEEKGMITVGNNDFAE